MSNDLISRSALLEKLKNWAFQECPIGICEPESDTYKTIKEFIEIIEEQPTAYDIGRVVEQLMRSSFPFEDDLNDKDVDLNKAIKIVKAGGVDE